MADRPDLGAPALDLRIVGRDAAILRDADDLADMIVGLLDEMPQAVAIAGGDEQRARASGPGASAVGFVGCRMAVLPAGPGPLNDRPRFPRLPFGPFLFWNKPS